MTQTLPKPIVFEDLNSDYRPNSQMDIKKNNHALREKFQFIKNQNYTKPRSQQGVRNKLFRQKDEGLQAHKLFKDQGAPLNRFTNDCDTHYKVSYLLIQRDLQGKPVLKEAGMRQQ